MVEEEEGAEQKTDQELQSWLDRQFAYLIKLAKRCHDHRDNERLGRAISALLTKSPNKEDVL
jgi:hypothetical protein